MNNMKFRVRDAEHSKQIQEALFAINVKWSGVRSEVSFTGAPYLYAEFGCYAEESNYLTYGHTEETFKRQTNCTETLLVAGKFVPAADYTPPMVDSTAVKALPRLRPRNEVAQERLVEILEAMVWAAKQGVVIPDAWDDEYDELREYLNLEYSN
jgi:hypothetical protein